MLPEVTFELLAKPGDALVIRIPFGSPAATHPAFWAPLASTLASSRPLGWIRFERRIVISSMVLFEATELRSACSAAPGQEPVLQASIQLQQGGP